jgi:hypothetical protein
MPNWKKVIVSGSDASLNSLLITGSAGSKITVGAVGGDEGGEILLGKPETNSTLTGSGVTIDIWQNRLRFFEQGGTARGYYIDITNGGAGVGTNLAAGSGTPGGSNTQIQYNNSNAFGGVPTLTYDGTTLRATGSFTGSFTGSLLGTATTASYVLQAVSASFASTASSADNFTVRNTLTATTIVVQTITSSVDFVTGSTRFGTLSSNTHQFTGSVGITGSLTVVGAVSASSFTGSLLGTASFATSASWAPGGGGASFPYTGSAVITGSLVVTGSFDIGPAKFNSTSSATTAGTTIVSSNATASYNSAFYNYYISSGSNARAGQIMSVWSGSTIQYTEVTTNDLGNTNTASFAVTLATGNVRLSFTAPGVWTVRSIVNLL